MNWLKYLVGLSAIIIAGCAAYFSVTGLGVLFSGASIAVMIMAGSLEFAKLVTATYLKQTWSTIRGFNKVYLTISVGILMLITSAGIFGYLSNAFQQQNIRLQQVDREIQVWNTKIQQDTIQISQINRQITELNRNQGKIIDGSDINNRLIKSIDSRDAQIGKLQDKIGVLQDSISKFNEKINEIRTNNIGLEREVGGFRFVAEAFGLELNTVVKFFILLIVIVFDPLAIALVIAFNGLILKKPEKLDDKGSSNTDIVEKNYQIYGDSGKNSEKPEEITGIVENNSKIDNISEIEQEEPKKQIAKYDADTGGYTYS